MRKIFGIVLIAALAMGISGCTGSNTGDKGTEQKTETTEQRTEKTEEKTETKAENEFEGEGRIIFAKPQKDDDDMPTRRIKDYTYKDNRALELVDYSSIRYEPVGTEIQPGDQQAAKNVFIDEYANRYKQVKGVEIEAEAGEERYEQTTTYDYSIFDFEEFNKAGEELGREKTESIDELTLMTQVAKDLRGQGYSEFRESDFAGKGTKTFEISTVDGGNRAYKVDYEDNEVKKFTISVNGEYSAMGSSKDKEEQAFSVLQQEEIKGVQYKGDFGDTEMSAEISFDFEEGDFEDFINNASYFPLGSRDDLNVAYLTAQLVTVGYKEK